MTLICCVNREEYTLPVSVEECHELPSLQCVEIQPSEFSDDRVHEQYMRVTIYEQGQVTLSQSNWLAVL